MKKNFSFNRIVILIITAFVITLSSCEKEPTTPASTTCDVRGIYSGTSVPAVGSPSTLTYNLKDNNFAVGSVTPTGPATTFGGYRNTCDSVIMSVFYNSNSSYYLLQGKISGTTISGTFKNLTTPSDIGTFSITK